MKISVFGTGMVGKAIASRLNELGHEVTVGTRDVESKLQQEASEGQVSFGAWLEELTNVKLQSFNDAAASAELIFNCTSGQATLAALELAGAANLKGKTLIDLANPLDFSQGMPPFLNPVNTDSLGEQVQNKFPEVNVVKSLNTMNANLMVNPTQLKGDHHVFMSGNSQEAKDEAGQLLMSFGWKKEQILDLGDISTSRGSEMLLPIWLRLWNALGTAEFNFHIQRN